MLCGMGCVLQRGHLLSVGGVALVVGSPRVVAALMSNESVEPLKTDSDL